MAKTEFIYLQGKCKWAKLVQPSQQYNQWKIDLYPDKDSLEIIKGLQEKGLKNELRKDEDGYFMAFNRPTSRTYNGQLRAFEPPEVVTPDGRKLYDQLVGNGSDVTIKLEVYPFKKFTGIAARLAAVRVDNLVPYTVSRDFDEGQQNLVRGLDDQPAQKNLAF